MIKVLAYIVFAAAFLSVSGDIAERYGQGAGTLAYVVGVGIFALVLRFP